MKLGEVDPDRSAKRANLQALAIRHPGTPWKGDPASTAAQVHARFIASSQGRISRKAHLPRKAAIAWPSERSPLLTVRAWCGQMFHNPDLLESKDDLETCLACIIRKQMFRHPSHPGDR